MQRKLYVVAIAALAAGAIGTVYAAKSQEEEATAVAAAKTTLNQAVNAAEQHVGGRASRAEYERHNAQWVYDVEVAKDAKVMDVKVDPATGKVLVAMEDKPDRDDHDDAD